MNRRLLAVPAASTTHGWARRARVTNPRKDRPEREQLERDIPEVHRRIDLYFPQHPPPRFDASRMGLTRMQRVLRELTETSPQVAADNFIQQFRKYLHRLLDH